MAVALFLAKLFETGKVKISAPRGGNEVLSDAHVGILLQERAKAICLGFPGVAPTLDLPVAVWAAEQLYRICQAAIYRELASEAVTALLDRSCPAAPAASKHWSADLAFLFLPDVLRLAQSASPHDPLVEYLRTLAAAWPLSSVGISNIGPRKVGELLEDDGLARLYLDRIFARQDWNRLTDPALYDSLRQSLGAYDSVWPQAAKALSDINNLAT
jgi:hypothetical protein